MNIKIIDLIITGYMLLVTGYTGQLITVSCEYAANCSKKH